MAVLIPGKLLFLQTPHTASMATSDVFRAAGGRAMFVSGATGAHATYEEIKRGDCRVEIKGPGWRGDPRKHMKGNEVIVTTVRNPYDSITTWFLRSHARKMGDKFSSVIRGVQHRPYIHNGLMWYHLPDAKRVMRYENLEGELESLLGALGLRYRPLARKNETKHKGNWMDLYREDPKAIDVVNERFSKEFSAYYEVVSTLEEMEKVYG